MGISLLIFALIVILVVALCIYLIDNLAVAPPFSVIFKAIIILIAIVIICNKAGLL